MSHPKLISRQEAIAFGLKRYFTGEPCKYGHITERWVRPDCCYECMRLRNLAYSRAHPEYFKAQASQWQKDNPEKRKAAQKRYEEKHAERVAKRKRKLALKQHHEKKSDPTYRARKQAGSKFWAEKNPERNRAHKRAYIERNRAALNAKAIERLRANPDATKATRAAGKAMRALASGTFSADEVRALLEQQGYRCAAPWCRTDVLHAFHCDHILPLSRGGSNFAENIQILCPTCNMSKNDRTMEEWQAARMVDAERAASVRPYRVDGTGFLT